MMIAYSPFYKLE